MSSLIVNSLITNQIISEAQERVKEDLNTARYVYLNKLKEIDRIIKWTSIRHILKKGLVERKVNFIREDLSAIMKEEKLDFLTLVDRNGIALLRVHHPEALGDSLLNDLFIQRALEKKSLSGTQIISGSELLKEGEALAKRADISLISTSRESKIQGVEENSVMVLKSAHPVFDFNGEVLGVITGGVLLNRNDEIVDEIKSVVFKETKYRGQEIGTATIFLGDLRIATNVFDKAGNRAIGTRAMKEVKEQVLGKGIPWVQRAFVVEDWYITAYEPIYDVKDRIVGMLYVGIREAKYTMLKERLILLFFLFSMSAMVFALSISFLLSWKILRKPRYGSFS
ncbi:MAG: cache domain-containing protein [Thermodesulfobacteriota bacterium]